MVELNWEFCECGCKQHCVGSGSISWSVYDAFNGRMFLFEPSHAGQYLKVFTTWDEINAFLEVRIKEKMREVNKNYDLLFKGVEH